MFCGIWITTFIAQIFIIQFGGVWFSTAYLDPEHWIVCITLGLSTLVFGQVRLKFSFFKIIFLDSCYNSK